MERSVPRVSSHYLQCTQSFLVVDIWRSLYLMCLHIIYSAHTVFVNFKITLGAFYTQFQY